MFSQVDFIGMESVAKVMEQSGLSRFIIYRQGAGTGSIPVFECIGTTQVKKAIDNFKMWAGQMIGMNPYNYQSYDMLLFENVGDENEEEAPPTRSRSKAKKNKIKFSFSLAGYAAGPNGGQQGFGAQSPQQSGNIEELVSNAVSSALQKVEQQRREDELLQRIEALENGEGEGDEDNTDSVGALDKVRDILKEINKNNRYRLGIAGDEDDDDDDDLEEDDDDDDDLEDDFDEDDSDEEAAEKITKKYGQMGEEKKVDDKMNRIKKALRILAQHDKSIDKDLMKLAMIAKKKPSIFKNLLGSLRALKI